MKKILLLIGMTAFTFALNVNLYTCNALVAGNEVTFDVCMDSDEAVGGIQFTFDGGTSGLSLTSAAGGLAADAVLLYQQVQAELCLVFHLPELKFLLQMD